ncbi:hypothetical protein HN803_06630 [candidate division WWE3 bacterium]|jgi:hypothetical protein|nr:hypothetical protein [candidate division WWE3 bacterium]MBT7350431.1 hypothetical protein [candidate division WWE3 bacterium]
MKETLLEIYKKADLNHPVAEAAMDFIEAYDGSNEEDLNSFFVLLLMTLQNYEIADAKAKGYDAVEELKNETDMQMRKIKSDMKDLKEGHLPPMPMESTGVDESEVTE